MKRAYSAAGHSANGQYWVLSRQVLGRFFSYPKKVTVEVVSTPVPFPSISLCNMRNLDFYILNTLNKSVPPVSVDEYSLVLREAPASFT